MVEKSFVAQHFRFTYTGPFTMEGFFHAVDEWAKENHYFKEIKDHAQRSPSKDKELRYSVELWKHVTTQDLAIVRMTAQMMHVKDITINRKGKKEKVQHASLTIDVDGLAERHKAHSWENQPGIYFFRGIIDRFLYKDLYELHEGAIAADTRNLYNKLKSYFHSEESKRAG